MNFIKGIFWVYLADRIDFLLFIKMMDYIHVFSKLNFS